MRKTSDEDRRDVIRRWLDGESYRQIEEEKDIGLASISRFIEELRKQAPDVDKLRKLNVRLRKGGFTVYDGFRACVLLESLNNYGISVSELQHYVNLSQRSLSDKKLQDNVMTYAVRLMQFELKYGKSYEEVAEDFNRLDQETDAKKTKNAELKQKNKKLKEEAEDKAETNRKLDAECVKISNKLDRISKAHEQLRDFGPEKLQKLAQFAYDIDALGFSVEEIQKLTILERELTRLGFDTDNLQRDVLRIRSLSGRADELESRVASFGKTTNQLSKTHTTLLAAQRMLQTNTIGIPCKSCGHLIDWRVPTKQECNNTASLGGFLKRTCSKCGGYQTRTLTEIVVHVAWPFLP